MAEDIRIPSCCRLTDYLIAAGLPLKIAWGSERKTAQWDDKNFPERSR
jgi:hypothetical protein